MRCFGFRVAFCGKVHRNAQKCTVSRQNSIQTLGTIDSCTRNQPWNGFSAAEGRRTNALSCEAVPRGSQRIAQLPPSPVSNCSTVFAKDNSTWGVSISRTKLPQQSGMRFSPHSLHSSSGLAALPAHICTRASLSSSHLITAIRTRWTGRRRDVPTGLFLPVT